MKTDKSDRLTDVEVPRRVFLAEGVRLAAMGSLGALAASLGWPEAAQAIDWSSLAGSRPSGGHGTVKEIRGRATGAGRPLAKGSKVASGEKIHVPRGGLLVLSLSDNTIMRINENTTLTLTMGRNRTGFFSLLAGSLLTVIPTGNRYLVQLPTAVIGIKGTVFYQQIFHKDETSAIGMEDKRYTIPKGVREYFCLCNGGADFLSKKSLGTFYTDQAEHHNSYYIVPGRSNPLMEAPMINHSDDQIRDLVKLQDGPKHSTDFLDSYDY